MLVVFVFVAATSFPLWSADAPDGAQVFKAKCAPCHGDNGEGKPAMKMPASKGTTMSVEEIVKYLTEGVSGKKIHSKPAPNLKPEEAKPVAEYVKEMK
jgi:mono/diheme cytochrome c family protein